MAMAIESTMLPGLPPSEVAIHRAVLRPSPEASIAFARTKPETMIQRPLPPYVLSRESINSSGLREAWKKERSTMIPTEDSRCLSG